MIRAPLALALIGIALTLIGIALTLIALTGAAAPAPLAAPAQTSPAALGAPADADALAGLTDVERRRILTLSPLPEPSRDPTNAVESDPRAAHLGQFLFFDRRLSANGEISCATCHDPARAFTDGKPLAEGLAVLDRHAPSLLNVAHNRWFFWDGRADTLWAQALDPIEEPREHGSTRREVLALLHRDAALGAAYDAIFGPVPDPDSAPAEAIDRAYSNLGKSIAAYVRRLESRRAPFDIFVEGLREGAPAKLAALTPSAQRGLRLFVGRANCRQCHGGPNFTDGEFHNTGVPPRGGERPRDPGRYDGVQRVQQNPFNAAGPFSDARDGPAAEKVRSIVRSAETWGQFKTPSLRNVERTAPYMHQGQFATLAEVIRFYSTLDGAVLASHHQEQVLLPLGLSDAEILDLESFLQSLTGEPVAEELCTAPASPAVVAAPAQGPISPPANGSPAVTDAYPETAPWPYASQGVP